MKKIKHYLCLLFASTSLFANQPSIVQLTPPILNPETISQEVVCTRPMREGKFQISIEKTEAPVSQTIVHCYGHGGSGWTTLFGSVNEAIALYESTHPSKETPIRVLGSGCMGLTTAIELARLDYKVEGITAKDLYNIPSWKAAGYFALVSVKTSPEEQDHLNQIGMETFLTYRSIEKGAHPYLTKEAVRFMPVYCSEDTASGVEDLEAKGLIPPKRLVTLDFGNGMQQKNFVEYMTYFMNTTTLMQQLHSQVKAMGIALNLQEVKSFEEIPESVIFNCTGLGARELNQDEAMIDVRGHLLVLSDKAGNQHMDYMIYSKCLQNEAEEYIYMFPKDLSVTPQNPQGTSCRSVLGGTFIPHVQQLSQQEQAELDQKEFKKLIDRNHFFFYGQPYPHQ